MIENEVIQKFIRFCVVGGTGLVVDFGFTWLFKEKVKLQRYISNSLGFMIAASGNYYLNRIWTFHSNDPEILFQYASFIVVSIVGLAINNLFLYIFESRFKLNFYLAKLGAIVLTTLWNFFMNYAYTFA